MREENEIWIGAGAVVKQLQIIEVVSAAYAFGTGAAAWRLRGVD